MPSSSKRVPDSATCTSAQADLHRNPLRIRDAQRTRARILRAGRP